MAKSKAKNNATDRRKKTPGEKRKEFVNYQSPADLAKFAKEAGQYIEDHNLFSDDNGERFPKLEAWQYLGENMGIYAITNKVERLRGMLDEDEVRYWAEATLHSMTQPDRILGQGFAVCSSKESFLSDSDESAVASMAQTRAIAKAYANRFRWLLPLAGFVEKDGGSDSLASGAVAVDKKPKELPIEDIKQKVSGKLALMESDTKFRLMRSVASTALVDKWSDSDWRNVYKELFGDAEQNTDV